MVLDVRGGRLVELLLLLQVRGRTSAPKLAEALEVSVRTVYRDVEALSAAGFPVFTETGRNGGIALLPGASPLPTMGGEHGRSLLLAGSPAIAAELGVGAVPPEAETAARSLREHLLVEPAGWWEATDEVPHLRTVARAVWDERLLRLGYRGRSRVVTPLGLVVKGSLWYLLTEDRAYRVSRIEEAEVLEHAAERPDGWDLAAAWEARKRAFTESIPTLVVRARVSPAGERHLGLLQEGTPPLPLPDDVRRGDDGWAVLDLRFERLESAGRLLLQLGADVEVLRPARLRRWLATEAGRLAAVY